MSFGLPSTEAALVGGRTMEDRRMRLRYPGSCARCGVSLAPGVEAWWSAETRTITCLACTPTGVVAGDFPAPSPATRPAATAGGSAQLEYDRRHQRDKERIEEQWGRLAGVVKFLREESQSTTAWAKGAQGERWVVVD
jgi:hypothetical protein